MHEKKYSIYKENGIIYCLYEEGTIMDLDLLREAIEARIEAAEGKPCPIFIDSKGVKYYTLEARKYGVSERALKDANAYGILVTSPILRTILNWSLKFYPVKGAPSRIFTSRTKALEWLKQFVTKGQ